MIKKILLEYPNDITGDSILGITIIWRRAGLKPFEHIDHRKNLALDRSFNFPVEE